VYDTGLNRFVMFAAIFRVVQSRSNSRTRPSTDKSQGWRGRRAVGNPLASVRLLVLGELGRRKPGVALEKTSLSYSKKLPDEGALAWLAWQSGAPQSLVVASLYCTISAI
jgi:hypothetical protein